MRRLGLRVEGCEVHLHHTVGADCLWATLVDEVRAIGKYTLSAGTEWRAVTKL